MFLNTEGGDMLSHMHYLTKCPVFLCRQGPTKPEVLSVQWPGKRSARRLQRNNSISPTNPQFNTGMAFHNLNVYKAHMHMWRKNKSSSQNFNLDVLTNSGPFTNQHTQINFRFNIGGTSSNCRENKYVA